MRWRTASGCARRRRPRACVGTRTRGRRCRTTANARCPRPLRPVRRRGRTAPSTPSVSSSNPTPGRLDDEQIGTGNPGADVAGGPDHEAVPREFGMQRADLLPHRGDRRLERLVHRSFPIGHALASSRSCRSRFITSLPPRPKWSCSRRYSAYSRSYTSAACGSGRYTARVTRPIVSLAARTFSYAPAATAAWIAEPKRRSLIGADDRDRHAQHVGVQLHQRTVAQQPTGDDELPHRYAGHAERLDDHPGAERRRLEQCPVSLLGAWCSASGR